MAASFWTCAIQGLEIVGFEEEPILHSYINAGVYVWSPTALSFLTHESYSGTSTLFKKMRNERRRTVAYTMREPLLDVGHPEDLSKVNNL